MSNRRHRIDSTSEQIRIMSAAGKPITPPSTIPLSKEDLPFFTNIIEEFAKADWTPHQLEMAALLAMAMADLYRNQIMLREEGEVVDGAYGGPITNPRKATVQMHQNAIVSFRRSLALHAAAQGQKEDAARRIAKAKQFEASIEDDDLIARPN